MLTNRLLSVPLTPECRRRRTNACRATVRNPTYRLLSECRHDLGLCLSLRARNDRILHLNLYLTLVLRTSCHLIVNLYHLRANAIMVLYGTNSMVLLTVLGRVNMRYQASTENSSRARNRRSTSPNKRRTMERTLINCHKSRQVRRRRSHEASGSEPFRALVRTIILRLRVRGRNMTSSGRRTRAMRPLRVGVLNSNSSHRGRTRNVSRRRPITRNNVLPIICLRSRVNRCVRGRNTKITSRRRRRRRSTMVSGPRLRRLRSGVE